MTDPNEIRDIVRQLAQEEVLSLIAQSTSPGDNRNGDQRGRQGVNAESVDIPLFEEESIGETIASTWDVSFSGSTATFKDCFFKRDSFTLCGGAWPDYDIDYTMPSTPTTAYVGFSYNTETGAVAIISGSTFGEVSEQSDPTTNVEIVKTPLYIMVLNGTSWSVKTNLVNIPVVGLSN